MIADGLREFGLLRGSSSDEALLESGAVSLFFPHGVGHMVGLGVRDAGEVLPAASRNRACPGSGPTCPWKSDTW